MSETTHDEFDPLRALQPDRVQPDDPGDPAVVSRQKERLMSMIDESSRTVSPSMMKATR